MRGTTQQIQNAKILSGETKTPVLSLGGQRLSCIVVPAGSSLDTKVASFSNVINGVEYPVRNSDGSAYSITLAAGMANVVDENFALGLSEFKIVVNSNAGSDADLILLGYQG